LLNWIEIRGIRGKENEFAHGLVFDQGPNLFRMMDITVVENEYASRPRVGVSEGNDKLLKELK
jgi:hypothetical protein